MSAGSNPWTSRHGIGCSPEAGAALHDGHGAAPPLNSPHPSSLASETTFIGDYFANDIAADPSGPGSLDYTTSVSTYNADGNTDNRQQQVVVIAEFPEDSTHVPGAVLDCERWPLEGRAWPVVWTIVSPPPTMPQGSINRCQPPGDQV